MAMPARSAPRPSRCPPAIATLLWPLIAIRLAAVAFRDALIAPYKTSDVREGSVNGVSVTV